MAANDRERADEPAAMKRDLVGEVDADVLASMLRFMRAIPGVADDLKVEHAAYALYCATGYLGDVGRDDDDARFLFAVNAAYWWWLDDKIDEHIAEPTSRVAWQALEATLAAAIEGRSYVASDDAEVVYLARLYVALSAREPHAADLRWWLCATRDTLRGFREGERVTRTKSAVSYAEQLESSMWSTSLVQVAACASTLFRWHAGDRKPFAPTTLERLLCLTSRLENDHFSIKRDLAEGCVTNLGVVVARTFPVERVPAFIEEQWHGYERRLHAELAALGDDDELGKMARRCLETHRGLYRTLPARYEGAA